MTAKRRRLPRPARISGLAAMAALALAACGTDLNPGTAATVDGTTISTGTVDDLVSAACDYSETNRLQQGSGTEPTQSIANLRSSITQQLVNFEITEAAVEELGLSVNDSTVSAIASQGVDSIPDSLSADDQEVLEAFFEDQSRDLLSQAVIGAHLRDESITVADESLAQEDVDAAQDFLQERTAEADVDVNPGYGVWEDGAVANASGSLSDAVSSSAKAAFGADRPVGDLPPSQVCG